MILGNSFAQADIPLSEPPVFRPIPKPKVAAKNKNKAALTIIKVKGESRLLIPRRFVDEAKAKTQRRSSGSSRSSQDIRMIFAGVLLSAGLVCLVLVKRHRKVLGGSLIVGAVTLGSLIGTEPANADLGVPFNPPSKRQPVRKVADVLGNQVGIELTDGCSVMLLLGDDYHVTGKESFAPKKMQTNGFGARPNGAADGIVPGRGQLVPAADATIIRGIPER